jgi:hypothetical protein
MLYFITNGIDEKEQNSKYKMKNPAQPNPLDYLFFGNDKVGDFSIPLYLPG